MNWSSKSLFKRLAVILIAGGICLGLASGQLIAQAQSVTPVSTVTPQINVGDSLVVTADYLRLRKGPRINFEVATVVERDDVVTVVDGPVVDGVDRWFKVIFNGQEGWATTKYLVLSDVSAPVTSPPNETTSPSEILPPPSDAQQFAVCSIVSVITSPKLELRKYPGLQQEEIESLPSGEEIVVLEGPVYTDGIPWYQVKHGSYIGWVPAGFLESTGRKEENCEITPSPRASKPKIPFSDNPLLATTISVCSIIAGLLVVFRLTRVQHLGSKAINITSFLLALGVVVIGIIGSVYRWEPPTLVEALPLSWFRVVYLANSIIAFIAFGFDKAVAKFNESHSNQGWRIPERTLHALEFLGGWPGALLGMLVFWHKIKKPAYWVLTLLIVIVHLAGWWLFSQ